MPNPKMVVVGDAAAAVPLLMFGVAKWRYLKLKPGQRRHWVIDAGNRVEVDAWTVRVYARTGAPVGLCTEFVGGVGYHRLVTHNAIVPFAPDQAVGVLGQLYKVRGAKAHYATQGRSYSASPYSLFRATNEKSTTYSLSDRGFVATSGSQMILTTAGPAVILTDASGNYKLNDMKGSEIALTGRPVSGIAYTVDGSEALFYSTIPATGDNPYVVYETSTLNGPKVTLSYNYMVEDNQMFGAYPAGYVSGKLTVVTERYASDDPAGDDLVGERHDSSGESSVMGTMPLCAFEYNPGPGVFFNTVGAGGGYFEKDGGLVGLRALEQPAAGGDERITAYQVFRYSPSGGYSRIGDPIFNETTYWTSPPPVGHLAYQHYPQGGALPVFFVNGVMHLWILFMVNARNVGGDYLYYDKQFRVYKSDGDYYIPSISQHPGESGWYPYWYSLGVVGAKDPAVFLSEQWVYGTGARPGSGIFAFSPDGRTQTLLYTLEGTYSTFQTVTEVTEGAALAKASIMMLVRGAGFNDPWKLLAIKKDSAVVIDSGTDYGANVPALEIHYVAEGRLWGIFRRRQVIEGVTHTKWYRVSDDGEMVERGSQVGVSLRFQSFVRSRMPLWAQG